MPTDNDCYLPEYSITTSPFALSEDWVQDAKSNNCSTYPGFFRTTLNDAKITTTASIVNYTITMLLLLSPTFILTLILLAVYMKKKELSEKAPVLLLIFGLVVLLNLSAWNTLVKAFTGFEFPNIYSDPIAELSLLAWLFALLLFIFQKISSRAKPKASEMKNKN
ncbi:MAG: hypothetical protein ABIF01_00265 [Candidatus Micrarchaeota archaeon]